MSYCSSLNVWEWLNKYSKSRNEYLGLGNGTTLIYNFTSGNIINGSYGLKQNSVSSGATATVIPTSSYSINLGDGVVSLTSGSLTSGNYLFGDCDYADIPDSVIIDLISASDREIERITGRSWNSSSVTEYIDISKNETTIFTKNYPLLTISSLAINENNETDTPAWTTLSAELGNDYLAYYDTGMIKFIDNKPDSGLQKVKVIYTCGYASVPYEIKRLSVLKTVKELLINPAYAQTILSGENLNQSLSIGIMDTEIDRCLGNLKKLRFEVV